MKKSLSLILALVMLISLLPMNVFAAETTESDANPYKGKVISILGDSISTFAGYIPVADGFNLEHLARYPQDNLLTDVNETWWMQTIVGLDAKLGINDSWRGATVSGAKPVTTGTTGENAAMGNLQRIKNLGANGTPDVILFYGGTNDLAHVSKVGTFDAANAPSTVDLTTTKWDNLADGYVHTLLRLQYFYPDAQIIAMLPTYTNGYYSDEKLAEGNAVLASICEYYDVTYVDLRECGISTADLPDNIHPDATGMDYITAAVIHILLNECEMEAGENFVHSVTHELTHAESSMGYYKGVSDGKSFVTTITGEDVTVSVTMGGVDITSECYENGVVSISEVTGDIVITAEGYAQLIYEDHLQQLPEDTCSGTNLWAELEHDKQYYTVNGWGIHSSGTVYSVTFPVSADDRIYATSFGAAGTNGSSINGIRVTWFDETGVLKSVSADEIYDEFSANGYIAVPEGAVVVSIPMWKVSNDNEIYIFNRHHCYENGICAGCGEVMDDGIWQIIENSEVIGAYVDLQEAVDACENGGTIQLTENCIVTSGATIEKNITIDGGNHLVDISGCSEVFITVAEGAEVTIRDLALDGGATGFEVDYDAVTYTNFTIPLVAGSLDNDPKASQSAIISSGTLICENVDISNRYTASYGGAMQILAGSASLADCDFTHNYGTSKGGALYIGSNFGTRTQYPVEMVTIANCTFTDNYTGHGGAIYAYNMAQMVIENSTFVGNTANGGKGGAIDLFSETTQPTATMALGLGFMQTTINGCRFEDNWAGNDGFAIQSYDSDLYIYDSEFIGNVGVHPTSSVGTVSIESHRWSDESWRIYTLLDSCLFEGNIGPAAVYGDHNSVSDLDVINCIFRNNRGNESFLLYSAITNMSNCQFIGETMARTVIDARIYENYQVPPLLTLTDVTFTDCVAPTEILIRKQNHNMDLNTYNVILQGITNGNITIWDNNAVTILGDHTGNVLLDSSTDRENLVIGDTATLNGIVVARQPADSEAVMGETFCVTVEAEGESLKYQWYFRNAGSDVWHKSGVRDNTYDDVMTKARAGREVYCVITDANGNTVTTETATLVHKIVELEIVTQPTNSEAILGENFCVTVEAQGEGLKYQWYFRNAGSETWYKSSVQDNTYDDVMTKARAGREVYCVITDAYGNSVTTDVATLIRIPIKLEITSQPTDATAAFGEMFCATVEANGEGLKYQWYYRNAGSDTWHKSGVRDNTYDDIMTKARNGREIYCVITDAYGNIVTTDVVKLTAVPKVELQLLGVSCESAAMGERYCVTVNAQGEGLTYQWYFRNAGSSTWHKSSVKDNTYDDVMTKARANREVYCVITDAFGNQVTTEVVTIWMIP